MLRFWVPTAALCALMLVTPNASAQTPPPTPPAITPLPIPTPKVPKPTPPVNPQPTVDVPAPIEEGPREKAPRPPRPLPDDPISDPIWWDIGYRYPGTYSTTRLMSLTDELERLGIKGNQTRRAIAPFIVTGYARFWDSWGEVRHADSGLRPHLGQDVFCSYGAAVLASESGTLEYGQDATGGLIVRLHRSDGSYWYYAHLSRFEPARSPGDEVEPGDVIGYCGSSGNAAGTPPHIHFGLFVDHVAQNPMGALIEWLHQAESHAARLLRKVGRAQPRRKIAAKLPLTTAFTPIAEARCYAPLPEEALELMVTLLPGEL